jgi:hypothetical protein
MVANWMCRPCGPQTGFGEINGDLREADFTRGMKRQTKRHLTRQN